MAKDIAASLRDIRATFRMIPPAGTTRRRHNPLCWGRPGTCPGTSSFLLYRIWVKNVSRNIRRQPVGGGLIQHSPGVR